MQAQPIERASRDPAGPLRGTQSLVGVMGFVWKHPSLTLLEVLWRWCAAVPLLLLLGQQLKAPWAAVPVHHAALGAMTFLEPVQAASTMMGQARLFLPALLPVARWWVPLALLVWTAFATFGRAALLRRADPALHPAYGGLLLAYGGRAVSFVLLLCLWLTAVLAAARAAVMAPAHHGAEPNVVLFTAEAVSLTLAAFLVWSLLVWVLDLWPLQAMTGRRPRTPEQRRELRSKLVETNLVMGIVRVALLVLAMTFSASPLPFQSQQTQAFITVWWIAVGVLYVLLSDFFHVVRRVTYLRLLESLAPKTIE